MHCTRSHIHTCTHTHVHTHVNESIHRTSVVWIGGAPSSPLGVGYAHTRAAHTGMRHTLHCTLHCGIDPGCAALPTGWVCTCRVRDSNLVGDGCHLLRGHRQVGRPVHNVCDVGRQSHKGVDAGACASIWRPVRWQCWVSTGLCTGQGHSGRS